MERRRNGSSCPPVHVLLATAVSPHGLKPFHRSLWDVPIGSPPKDLQQQQRLGEGKGPAWGPGGSVLKPSDPALKLLHQRWHLLLLSWWWLSV